MVVQDALDSLNIKYLSIELGLVETPEKTSEEQRQQLS
jgi:hypothetical protein